MNNVALKDEMKKLWKETFHDSDAYINLVFDNYYNPDLMECHEEDGQLIAGLLGVPYLFGTEKNNLRGLYLCGLSTRPEFRRKGIMHNLFNKIKDTAKERGFDFIFLIPANEGLKKYYRYLGMSESFYRVKNRYTSAHDFDRDYLNYLEKEDHRVGALKKNYWESLNTSVLDVTDKQERKSVIDFIYTLQQNENPFGLLHSEKDMEAVIDENAISEGKIVLCRKRNNELTGVAFTTDDNNTTVVSKIYSADRCTFYRILSAVKKSKPENSLIVMQLPEEMKRTALWTENYAAVLPESPLVDAVGEALRTYDSSQAAESGGMITFLNVREILIFLNNITKDSKYSILVKDDENGKIIHYMSEKGEWKETVLEESQITSMKLPLVMTIQNLTDILCRRPDKNKFMMEAFGLPRLSLNMSLLLE